MGFADLLWDSGKDNMGGIVGEIYFCPVEDIETLPALSAVGSLQTAVDDIVCKAGKKFHRIYHTAETGKVESTTVGDFDGKSKLNLLSFFYPGDDETLAEQVRLLQNTPGVYICSDSKGNLRLLGVTNFDEDSTELTLESPAYIQITNGTLGAAGADRRGTTFEVVHKAPHRAVFYRGAVPTSSGGEVDLLPVSLDGGIVSFAADEASAQNGGNSAIGPMMIWDDGRCYLVYQDPSSGKKHIVIYDERYGVLKPVGFHPQTESYDSHHRPAIKKFGDYLFQVVERVHGIGNMAIFKSRSTDPLIWERSATTIPANATYPHLLEVDGILVNINQYDDIEVGFNRNSSADFEGTWEEEVAISTRAANEDEHYAGFVLNGGKLTGNKIVFIITGRNDDVTPAIWFNKYLIKAEITSDGYTFYNWSESFSKTSRLTSAEMASNCLYHATSATTQGYIPVAALDNAGNFYDVSGDGSGGYVFVYQLHGDTTPTVKAVSLPGSPTIVDAQTIGGNNQMGGCAGLMPRSTTEVYAVFRITVGDYDKLVLFKTIDLGDNWTNEGDIFSSLDVDIESFYCPANYGDIPNNRNFIFAATGIASPTRAPLYIKKVAFGSVQSESNPYDSITAFTEAEYETLMLSRYHIKTGKIANTGTTLDTVIDQGSRAANITTGGSPVLNDADNPTYVTMDGTNDRLPLSVTGLADLTEGTIIVVAKGRVGSNANFVTISNNTSTTDYWGIGKSLDEKTRFVRGAPPVEDIRGNDVLTDDFHIYVFTWQNGAGTDILQWADGRLQKRTVVLGTDDEGRFLVYPETITNIEIGRLVRTTLAYYQFDFKDFAITGTPLNLEQTMKACKYLSEEHSILLNSPFQ